MLIQAHTVDDFAAAMRALLLPGVVWDWPAGGLGDALLHAMAQEPARIEALVQPLMDDAVSKHAIAVTTWRMADYQAVAEGSQSSAAAKAGVTCSAVRPLCAGFKAGALVWGQRARYLLFVAYDGAVVDAQALFDALTAFKLAHTFIWLSDTSGSSTWSWHVQN